MVRIPLADALDHCGIPHWGNGFFGISNRGQLTVLPTRDPGREVVLADVLERLREDGRDTPFVLRFPQILSSRVEELVSAFHTAMDEFDYVGGGYLPVFPLKVNQRSGVVESLLRAGREHGLGLEVGSRAELMIALALDLPQDALLVVNGYKDRHTLELATIGARLGRRVVIVLEKLFEVDLVLRWFAEAGDGPLPELGVRTRLSARGSGKWWKSSGTTAKFGLTTAGIIEAVDRLRSAGWLGRLSMLHFHIGSQIPEIRRLKIAFREGARVYAKLRRFDVPISLFNVGGGLAVDYDGSKTASDASMDYSVGEYANDVVYAVREVCIEEDVPVPTLVSESGRALTAYHAVLVAEVLDRISADPPLTAESTVQDGAPRVLEELVALRDEIGAKTYREFYHDAIVHRDELATMFDIGILTLEQRALAEQLFWDIARRALSFARRERFPPEEFEQLERAMHEKYILNFSVFQSAPDHWALEQLFPVVPLTRLTETATRHATLVDITCDSDGEIARFVDIKAFKDSLALHDPDERPDEPYDLAITLVGAYQDVMGDLHNLFGTPDDVYVTVGENGEARIEPLVPGDTVSDVVRTVGYRSENLIEAVRSFIARRRDEGALRPGAARELERAYRSMFDRGTYLEPRARRPRSVTADPEAPG
ncbi:MAG: biosynthetic arginine decarboxylase [Acidobacteriota bacterium]|nr:biosynthetic arginine decarboxylase [Acidobacteriota bacterium]